MCWKVHPAKSAFAEFARDWDHLNARLHHSHPFFDSRFIGALLDHFANDRELLCLHYRQDVIDGALILEPAGSGRWTSFRPSQAQITALLIDDAELLNSLFHALPGPAWTIELIAIDPRYSPNFLAPDMANIVSAQAYTIGVHPGISFSDYWEQRPKKLKANMQRYFNRFEKEFNAPVLTRITATHTMKTGVIRFGSLESAGWKGAEGTAISGDNTQGAFYIDVMARFASTGQAAVYEIIAGGNLAASRLVIESEHMTVFLKTTYDESLSHIAPGRIMLYQVIEERRGNQPEQSIEFYTNATRDQKEWATFGCTIENIQVFRNKCFANGFATLKAFQNVLRRNGGRGDSPPEEAGIGVSTGIETLLAAGIDPESLQPGGNAELSLDWFELLHKTIYPEDSGVRYFHVTDSNRRTTLLPVRLTQQGRIKTIEALGNFYTSLYSPLHSPDSDRFALRHLLGAAIKEHGGAHVMHFAPLDCESPMYDQLINELRAIGWIPFSFHCFGNWYLDVRDNWEGYLRKRSANLRSTIKRRNKDFAAAGGSLEVVSSGDGLEQAIDDFQAVYSASWKVPEPYPDFVPSLIRRLAEKGMLRLGVARLQGKPVAAQIWIVTGGRASIFKLAYHEAYAEYSPGTVLTSHLLQYVIEQDRVREVDFLKGDDKYKRIWMSNRRERRGIVAYNPATFIGFALFIKELIGRMAKLTRRKEHA